MVAQTMSLPNVRKLFVPDPGHLICDVDLDRADLQVVVWEAEDEDLKRQLKMGVDLHIMNGILLEQKSPPPEDELVESHPEYPEHKQRYKKARVFAKAFVHGTNYGGKARTMSIAAGTTIHQMEIMQARWFAIHPGIQRWHDRTQHYLETRRYVENAFGYRRFYFDRIEHLLPEALAWIPQSTVAVIINQGLANIDEHLPEVELVIQVHDSLVFQFQKRYRYTILPQIRDELLITVPYPDPLIIPVGAQLSDKSWGDCKPVDWE